MTIIVNEKINVTKNFFLCLLLLIIFRNTQPPLFNRYIIENFAFFQGWLNLHKSSLIAASSKKSYPRSGSQRETYSVVTKDLLKKRIILLAVLRREIERLSIWRNPKVLPELRVPGEDIVQGWATQQPMTDKTWKDCIRVVWSVCPHAAVHITLRYISFVYKYFFSYIRFPWILSVEQDYNWIF